MDQLYQWMKDALAHFGLSFHEMDKVKVHIDSDKCRLTFIYGDQEVSYKIPKE